MRLEGKECQEAQRSHLSLPSVPRPFLLSHLSWLARFHALRPDGIGLRGPPSLPSRSFWLCEPPPCCQAPHDPRGLACNSLFPGLCVFPVCSTLPAPPGSGPSASPCLPLQTQVSCVCRQSHASQWGPGLQKGHFQGTLGAAAGRAEATV